MAVPVRSPIISRSYARPEAAASGRSDSASPIERHELLGAPEQVRVCQGQLSECAIFRRACTHRARNGRGSNNASLDLPELRSDGCEMFLVLGLAVRRKRTPILRATLHPRQPPDLLARARPEDDGKDTHAVLVSPLDQRGELFAEYEVRGERISLDQKNAHHAPVYRQLDLPIPTIARADLPRPRAQENVADKAQLNPARPRPRWDRSTAADGERECARASPLDSLHRRLDRPCFIDGTVKIR